MEPYNSLLVTMALNFWGMYWMKRQKLTVKRLQKPLELDVCGIMEVQKLLPLRCLEHPEAGHIC